MIEQWQIEHHKLSERRRRKRMGDRSNRYAMQKLETMSEKKSVKRTGIPSRVENLVNILCGVSVYSQFEIKEGHHSIS